VGSSPGHGRTVAPVRDRGEHEIAASSSSFDCIAEINQVPL